MANYIYLKQKVELQLVAGSSAKYAHLFEVELKDSSTGALVPADFLQTNECTAAFVAVTPYGAILATDVNTAGTDSLKITAHPKHVAGTSSDVTETLTYTQLKGVSVGSRVYASA